MLLIDKSKAGAGEIAPAKGKLGIMIPGMGAVATTFMAGVEAVRKGICQAHRLADADGNHPPRQAHRRPLAEDQGLRSARRARTTWSSAAGTSSRTTVRRRGARPACSSARCSSRSSRFCDAIKPRTAVFDQNYVKKLDGPNVKKGKNKMDLAEQVRDDIRDFKKTQRRRPPGDDLVRLDRELPSKPSAVHQIAGGLREGAAKPTTRTSRLRRSTPTPR